MKNQILLPISPPPQASPEARYQLPKTHHHVILPSSSLSPPSLFYLYTLLFSPKPKPSTATRLSHTTSQNPLPNPRAQICNTFNHLAGANAKLHALLRARARQRQLEPIQGTRARTHSPGNTTTRPCSKRRPFYASTTRDRSKPRSLILIDRERHPRWPSKSGSGWRSCGCWVCVCVQERCGRLASFSSPPPSQSFRLTD